MILKTNWKSTFTHRNTKKHQVAEIGHSKYEAWLAEAESRVPGHRGAGLGPHTYPTAAAAVGHRTTGEL